MYVAPSILSADFGRLAEEIRAVCEAGADLIHIDVMDGSFVPQISYGQPVITSLRAQTELPFDVHLMTEHPERHVDSFAASGADWITFHIEGTVHVHRVIEHIKSLGKKAGVAFVPSTPVAALSEILPLVDLVLVMTVNPGFGGQSFIPSCVGKIETLAAIKKQKNLSFDISVDGGVNKATAPLVIGAGADILVSGSAFFKGEFDLESV